MAKPNSKWYKLDSAGTLYSALQKEEYSAIYRFSALMEKDVDPAALQRAIDRCMPRFPTFAVRIRKGAFWYYLEHNSAPGPFLKEDVSDPCQPVRFKEDNGWLVRFYYYRNRISIEVFHALSDGGGAIVFFRTKRETQEIADKLIRDGYNAESLHGDLSQPQRDLTMQKFRSHLTQILVATDVAARGLDVDDLTHVINYGLPSDIESYTHRSGRTGRAGKKGDRQGL